MQHNSQTIKVKITEIKAIAKAVKAFESSRACNAGFVLTIDHSSEQSTGACEVRMISFYSEMALIDFSTVINTMPIVTTASLIMPDPIIGKTTL